MFRSIFVGLCAAYVCVASSEAQCLNSNYLSQELQQLDDQMESLTVQFAIEQLGKRPGGFVAVMALGGSLVETLADSSDGQLDQYVGVSEAIMITAGLYCLANSSECEAVFGELAVTGAQIGLLSKRQSDLRARAC
jgi:hypothetical protein